MEFYDFSLNLIKKKNYPIQYDISVGALFLDVISVHRCHSRRAECALQNVPDLVVELRVLKTANHISF